MARITLEDCSQYVANRFELILLATQRGKELNHGAVSHIDNVKKEKEAITALREIAAGLLVIENLERSIVKKSSVEETKNLQSSSEEKTFDEINNEVLAEIELLKPHILFLELKNYIVTTCTNGADAIDLVDENNFDIVFLDENMPGLSGLDTLAEIKQKQANLPVVMITKSEEEYIMEEAIGSKIADYLIKPVNPNQILLSLKKNLDHSRLVSEKTTSNYQQEFRKITMDLAIVNSYQDWIELYKKLVHWELELENISDSGMLGILESQKQEANNQFFKFIKKKFF
jgi:DNA-directed RNA polymerase omega subunit